MKIRLEELQAQNLPVCTVDDVMSVYGPHTEEGQKDWAEVFEKMNAYLKAFLPPRKNCINCEEEIGGYFGTFTWTIVHGEGKCGRCGWPVRVVHHIEDMAKLTTMLQYHPSGLSRREKSKVPDVGDENQKWKVCYDVRGFGKQETDPYETLDIAMEHKRDIEGYEGVSNVTLVPVPTNNGQ